VTVSGFWNVRSEGGQVDKDIASRGMWSKPQESNLRRQELGVSWGGMPQGKELGRLQAA